MIDPSARWWRRAVLGLVSAVALAMPISADAAPRAADAVGRIANGRAFAAASRSLDTGFDAMVAEIIELTEIPAPPFKEARRAQAYAAKFRAAGLADVEIDPEGNVTGLRAGVDPKAGLIVISAHLDTVFPEGTPIKVRREGTRLYAPGVGDDTRGLTALLAYIRALDAAKVRTRHPILFVGTVGEEGRGSSRGARYLLGKGRYKGRVDAFISMDGSDPRMIVDRGVGSKRYRVVFKGPGGHSYEAFGIVNPMAAMAEVVTQLYAIQVRDTPKTTYSASVTGGGTSVNAIPAEVFMEFDLRSEDAGALVDLDRRFHAIIDAAVATENGRRSTRLGKVSADLQVLGERQVGATSRDAALVRAAAGAIVARGYVPNYISASTDANAAMALGIPAVTMGSGGQETNIHSTAEWIDVAKPENLRGLSVGLLTLMTIADAVP